MEAAAELSMKTTPNTCDLHTMFFHLALQTHLALKYNLCGGARFTETRMPGSLVTNPIPSHSFHIIFTSSPKRKEDALKADGSKVACTKSGA